jgi:hypothetical protein
MELHQLRYFCAVAHNGNFKRAAKADNVARPSLSQQILSCCDSGEWGRDGDVLLGNV